MVKAVVVKRFGGPEVLEVTNDYQLPERQAGEVSSEFKLSFRTGHAVHAAIITVGLRRYEFEWGADSRQGPLYLGQSGRLQDARVRPVRSKAPKGRSQRELFSHCSQGRVPYLGADCKLFPLSRRFWVVMWLA